MPEIGAEGDDPIGGPKTAAQEADDVQVTEPFAIGHIALAPRYVLHVARVDEEDGEATRFEDLVDRNPVDARGFHRHAGHAARRERVGQAMEIARERGE